MTIEFRQPYNGVRATWKRKIYGLVGGVYVIKDKLEDEILYVGMSKKNVYSALYRHFQSWNDSPSRVTYSNECRSKLLVGVIPIKDSEVHELEISLIHKLNPRDNTVVYKFHYDSGINSGCWFWEEHLRMNGVRVPF